MSDDNKLTPLPNPNSDDSGDDQHGNLPTEQPAPVPDDDAEPPYDVAGAALGALPPSEEADLYAAAATDTSVSADLATMEAVAAELARLAPQSLMNRGRSAGIRSRLVARAAATRIGRPVVKSTAPDAEQAAARATQRPTATSSHARRPQPPAHGHGSGTTSARQSTGSHYIPFEPPERTGFGRVLGGIAVAVAVVAIAFGVYNWRQRDRLGAGGPALAAGQDSSVAMQIATLRATVAQKDSLIAALTGMHTRVIDLTSYSSAEPMARMFWDQKQQMFIMYAANLKQPPTGKTYQVWLMTRGGTAPISAGTFTPDSAGSATMTVRSPMPAGALRRVAVTEEDAGGVAAPTGPVMFSGVGR